MSATVLLGQWGALLAWPVTAFWWLGRSGRWFAAGLWLDFAISLKLFLAPLSGWCLLRRDARVAVLGSLLGATAAVALGAAVYGPFAYLEWINQLRSVSWYWGVTNASVWGWIARTWSPSPYFTAVAHLPISWVYGLSIALSTIVGVISLLRAQHVDVDQAVALLVIASLWCSPLGWIYYGWLALPPVLWLWLDGRLPPLLVLAGAVLLLWSPLPIFGWLSVRGVQTGWWSFTLGSAYFWGLTAFLLAAYYARPTNGVSRGNAPVSSAEEVSNPLGGARKSLIHLGALQ